MCSYERMSEIKLIFPYNRHESEKVYTVPAYIFTACSQRAAVGLMGSVEQELRLDRPRRVIKLSSNANELWCVPGLNWYT